MNMKKYLFLLMFGVALTVSCAEETNTSVRVVDNVVVTATISGTKVSYSGDGANNLKASWAVGDVLVGFDEAEGKWQMHIESSADIVEGKATFTVDQRPSLADGRKVYMFYAPGKSAADVGVKTLEVDISSQTQCALPALMSASGVVSGGNLALMFKNETAIVGVQHPSFVDLDAGDVTGFTVAGPHVYTKATFSLQDGEVVLTPSVVGTVSVSCNISVSDTAYIALLPSSTAADVTFATSGTKYRQVKKVSKTFAAGNYYYLDKPSFALPDGALIGQFTVNASGKKVRFAKGNLYYTGSEWSFEANQWDASDSHEGSHIGTFYWTTQNNYGAGGYAALPDPKTSDTINWGIPYCSANYEGGWQTLSKAEWEYIITNSVHAYKTLHEVDGLVILPDTYSGSIPADDDITSSWTTMETAGAVFIPCNVWSSSSHESDTDKAYWLKAAKTPSLNTASRSGLKSVRLVIE